MVLIYFSPPQYINSPKFIILKILKLPLNLARSFFNEINFHARSKGMMEENIVLCQTVSALTSQIVRYKDIELENQRLRSLLEFKNSPEVKLTAACIIAKDSSNFSDTISIDKGSGNGINKDTVVLSEAGLVGRVYESFPGLSRVILITDPNSRVSAVTLKSRHIGVVYGMLSGKCIMKYMPIDADIAEGEEVLTSGYSDIYPKGIFIGRVLNTAKDPGGLSRSAIIQPAVDFSKLEEVLCAR